MVHGHAAAPLPEQMRLLAGVLIITVAAGDEKWASMANNAECPHPPRDALLPAGPYRPLTTRFCLLLPKLLAFDPQRLAASGPALLWWSPLW